jgi:hypothetical protein
MRKPRGSELKTHLLQQILEAPENEALDGQRLYGLGRPLSDR